MHRRRFFFAHAALHKFIFYTVVGRWPPEIGATKTATAGLIKYLVMAEIAKK